MRFIRRPNPRWKWWTHPAWVALSLTLGMMFLAGTPVQAAQEPDYKAKRRIIPPLTPSVSAAFSDPDTADPMVEAEMQQTKPPITEKTPSLRDTAFKQLLNKNMPLTNDQILEYHKQYHEAEQAMHTSPTTPPQPISSTITLDLSPGTQPPVIRLAPGFVSSLVFLDSTGQPWPIADFSLGNSKQFNVQWDNKKNTLFIQSTNEFTSSNLALRLAEMDTPVMLSLVSGQREVDYRVDVQVTGRGPNALPLVVEELLPAATSATLIGTLDGIPPPGSKELSVSEKAGRAWVWNSHLLFRTPYVVLSPAWTSTVSSADGTHVYELPKTPLILVSKDGKTLKVELKGW